MELVRAIALFCINAGLPCILPTVILAMGCENVSERLIPKKAVWGSRFPALSQKNANGRGTVGVWRVEG
jgi:hypothetical protein